MQPISRQPYFIPDHLAVNAGMAGIFIFRNPLSAVRG